MKVLGFITARGGSKGMPGKNLRPLGGHPLVAHMISAALQAKRIDRLILSTDDEEIMETGRAYGIEIPFKRPSELADDTATALAVAQHSQQAMDALGYEADVTVHMFPTCPFVPPEKIDAIIDKVVVEGCDSGMALRRVEHDHPYRIQVINDHGLVVPYLDGVDNLQNVNRQQLDAVYARAGAVYARKRALLEDWNGQDMALGERRGGVVLDDIEATNIDRELDLKFAEFAVTEGLARLSVG